MRPIPRRFLGTTAADVVPMDETAGGCAGRSASTDAFRGFASARDIWALRSGKLDEVGSLRPCSCVGCGLGLWFVVAARGGLGLGLLGSRTTSGEGLRKSMTTREEDAPLDPVETGVLLDDTGFVLNAAKNSVLC